MKIVALSASNVKRIKAVHIEPDGSLVTVGGRNGQGKSSVLDSIMYALAGKSSIPAQPIRHGERRAKVEVELDGGLKVVRHFSQTDARLVVTQDGEAVKSPQKLLDTLCSGIAFDPLEYSRMPAKKQLDVLRSMVGLDTSELDRERAELFEERARVNRDLKGARGRMESIQVDPDAPEQEISISDVIAEMNAARDVIDAHRTARRDLEAREVELGRFQRNVVTIEDRVAALRAELALAIKALEEAKQVASDAAQELATMEAEVAALVDPDISALQAKVSEADAINAKVRQKRLRDEARRDVTKLELQSAVLTDGIADVDAAKEKALSEAAFPVAGLGFDEDGVLLNGVPLEQASQAERLRVSVAMGFALNPTLKVLLVRDGSLLDSDSLAMVAKLAEDADGQLWLEVVSEDGDGCSVVIEDGEIAGGA